MHVDDTSTQMIYGIQDGKRVRIDEYVEGVVRCEEGHILIPKKGNVRAHHFAHSPGVVCSSSKEMTSWHLEWQSRVPIENREVRMGPHIADISISGYIVEIQHSPMTEKVMRERESFYTKTHTLIWVFDTRTWMYSVTRTDGGNKVTILRKSGCEFPLYGEYRGKVMKIFDFGKRELLVVESQSKTTIKGRVITMDEFDHLIQTPLDNDTRPFHHPL